MKKTRISSAVVSVNGNIRGRNEDNFFINGNTLEESGISYPSYTSTLCEKNHLICVFDGMGGENKGELASLIATNDFKIFYNDFRKTKRKSNLKLIMDDQLNHLNSEINHQTKVLNIKSMGTTIAALVIHDGFAYMYNLGDSRIYLYRRKKIRQITNDHTEAAILIKLGVIKNEEARTHMSKYKLTQHLGIDTDGLTIESESYEPIQLLPNDLFILCSDGLNDDLTDAMIADIIDKNGDIDNAINEMVDKALKIGGHDNITIIGIKIEKIYSFLGFKA